MKPPARNGHAMKLSISDLVPVVEEPLERLLDFLGRMLVSVLDDGEIGLLFAIRYRDETIAPLPKRGQIRGQHGIANIWTREVAVYALRVA